VGGGDAGEEGTPGGNGERGSGGGDGVERPRWMGASGSPARRRRIVARGGGGAGPGSRDPATVL